MSLEPGLPPRFATSLPKDNESQKQLHKDRITKNTSTPVSVVVVM